MQWPKWWGWTLECTPHVEKRMTQRGFSEIALREMLDKAKGIRPDVVPGRWLAQTRHRGSEWAVIVEPDADTRSLVVITAYPVG